MINTGQILIGVMLSFTICVIAWYAKALSFSGVLMAFFMGSLIFGLGGINWAVILLTFFISSSFLSRVFVKRKSLLAEKIFTKNSRRDWGQVLANGGFGIFLVLISIMVKKPQFVWIIYCGAVATVNSDTWATELGVLSKNLPRKITTGKVVETGTSGGISILGYLSAFGGALLIAIVALLFGESISRSIMLMVAIIMGGLIGSTFDSFLGASVQAIYICESCNKETEQCPRHKCGSLTTYKRGWRWLNNDWVNFLSSVVGGVVTGMCWLVIITH